MALSPVFPGRDACGIGAADFTTRLAVEGAVECGATIGDSVLRNGGVGGGEFPAVEDARVDVELDRNARLQEAVGVVDVFVTEDLEVADIDVGGR